MTAGAAFSSLGNNSVRIVDEILRIDQRLLLVGETGIGKSTLAAAIADAMALSGRSCWCVSADPGTPAFGVPGVVSLARRHNHHWQTIEQQPLCTLDAARFRLPLISAVKRLLPKETLGTLLIDAPGTVRGVAGAELLLALAEVTRTDQVLVLVREGKALPLCNELRSLSVPVWIVSASAEATRPSKQSRARQRTTQWDAFLNNAAVCNFATADLKLLGTPPPLDIPAAWLGRQVALLEGQRLTAFGEVTAMNKATINARMIVLHNGGTTLLVRDAQRSSDGLLSTAKPFASAAIQYLPAVDKTSDAFHIRSRGPRPVAEVGPVVATLVNGVLGDALLHLRMRHQKRSLLFDLGEAGRLPARIAHQVTDVFISHAHIDHIGGFLWLLRSRIAVLPTCRLFGPAGLADHIEGMVRGISWDRVGEQAPAFEIAEFHGDKLQRFIVQAGRLGCEPLEPNAITDGVLYREPAFQIRATLLDHKTPVMAFALEPSQQINVRKERLSALGLAAGPWLRQLKDCVTKQDLDRAIALPDGSIRNAGELSDTLLLISAGEKLVYATDLADTIANRKHLTELARHAHTFFCEATFREADHARAARTGHLTTRACGEIATAANVGRLIPFHFSRRYEANLDDVYDEIRDACSRVMVP
jgi:ribonuclease Z